MIILPNVFISYKSEEYADANKLRTALSNAGITCWMAPESIPGGSDYATEISKAIKSCPVFVLILSSAAQKSKHVAKESEIAVKHDKIILPYIIENCVLSDGFEYRLADAQFYWPYQDEKTAQEKLIFDIRGYLDNVSNGSVLDDDLRPSRLSISHSEEEKVFKLLQEESNGNAAVCVQPTNAVLLGKAYESGTQVVKDISKAQYYYTAGIYYGNDEAKFLLARLNLENQLNTDQCDSQIQQIIEAAENGYDEACIYLGNLFFDGKHVAQSYEKAVSYWKKAEEHKNAEAQYLLAFCYANEKGVPANYNLARMLAEQSNQQGYPRGARMLGHIYRDGLGCPQDLDKAESYYKLAVERGDYASEVLLGTLYWEKKDYEASFVYYSLAADRGDPRGMYNVAWAYRTGEGVSEDQENAIEWFLRAVEAGHERAKEDVVWSIQQMTDLDKRLELNLRAFELGCYGVANRLYFAYSCVGDYESRHDLKDVEKAFFFIQKSAENGDHIAEVMLARAYSTVIWSDKFDGKYNNSELAIQQYRKIINKRKNNEDLINQFTYDYAECCFGYACEQICKNCDYRNYETEILDVISASLTYSSKFFTGFSILMKGLTGAEGSNCPTNHPLSKQIYALLTKQYNNHNKLGYEKDDAKLEIPYLLFAEELSALTSDVRQIIEHLISLSKEPKNNHNLADIAFWGSNIVSFLFKKFELWFIPVGLREDVEKMLRNVRADCCDIIKTLMNYYPEGHRFDWIGTATELYGDRLQMIINENGASEESKYLTYLRSNNKHMLTEQSNTVQLCCNNSSKTTLTVDRQAFFDAEKQRNKDIPEDEQLHGEEEYFVDFMPNLPLKYNKRYQVEFQITRCENIKSVTVSTNCSDLCFKKEICNTELPQTLAVSFNDFPSKWVVWSDPTSIKITKQVTFSCVPESLIDPAKVGVVEIANVCIKQ